MVEYTIAHEFQVDLYIIEMWYEQWLKAISGKWGSYNQSRIEMRYQWKVWNIHKEWQDMKATSLDAARMELKRYETSSEVEEGVGPCGCLCNYEDCESDES